MFRVEGEVVRSLQSTFSENWLESSGEILCDENCFATFKTDGNVPAMIVDSSPSVGRSTRVRMLYQTLIASAKKTIYITTPYFLPDRGARDEIIRACKERKVEVKIITPGQKSDHLLTRRSSRRLYGDLLKAGIKIFEYKPSMIHTKSMIIDGLWSVVGSTNFDPRSFSLNDEVNLVTVDKDVAARITQDFVEDLSHGEAISYEKWSRRSIIERIHEAFGWILERQQ
jgi:cardiolipin synthase